MLTPAEFNGKISLKLPQRVYSIVAFSSDKVIGDYIDLRTLPKNDPINYTNTGIPYNDLTQEMFRGEADFTVGETSVLKTIEMGRLMCKINLALDDFSKLPSNVQSLTVMVNCTPVGFYLNGLSQFLTGDQYLENQEIVANGTPNTNNSYFRIAIPKDQIANYSSTNPFSFYFPKNQVFMYENNELVEAPGQGQSLYLIGFDQDVRVSKTAKVVYKKLIKRNLQTVSNLSLTITGSVLKDAMGISVNEIWNERREIKF